MIESEDQLDDLLSEPTPEVIEMMARLDGDIVLLGVSGKMGPSLARMAKRASVAASVERRVIGVSRFSAEGAAEMQRFGIETIRCDLLDEDQLARLPDADNVIYLAGRKFGSSGDEATTWAMNSYLPGLVGRKYRQSRLVIFSTGNIYGLTSIHGHGSRESDVPNPVGEYAMSCLGRERIFEYFSQTHGTPMAVVRLNYACDLRYGILVDLAQQIRTGQTISLAMGYFNTIWQGDVNAMTLRTFDCLASPPWVVNMTGPERLSVRSVCEQLGKLMGKSVHFTGTEKDTALLSDASLALKRLGPLNTPADQLIEWVACWTMRGGKSLGKPTHFESREGKF